MPYPTDRDQVKVDNIFSNRYESPFRANYMLMSNTPGSNLLLKQGKTTLTQLNKAQIGMAGW